MNKFIGINGSVSNAGNGTQNINIGTFPAASEGGKEKNSGKLELLRCILRLFTLWIRKD